MNSGHRGKRIYGRERGPRVRSRGSADPRAGGGRSED